ncbi:tetratricopeptide repeat protein [Streptomyces bluensis]|uniref:Tol-pal system YbgF family protein n=1 Tax=Streptomyces bluensis TaxID=33897 RepID=A0ABW6UWD0_9ACTN
MARNDPNHDLKRLLSEAGLTGEALARSVNLAAAETNKVLRYTRKSVASWLAGSRPPAPVPALVAEILTRRIGRHITIQETGLALVPDEPMDALRATGGSAPAALTMLTAADTGATTRGAFRALPFRLTNVPPAWVDTGPHPAAGDRRLGAGELDAVAYATKYYSDTINTFGGAHGRTALAAYLATDGAAFLTARADPTTQTRILGQLSRLTHLLARMCADCGQAGASQQYFNVAAQLAIEAQDRTLYAVTLRAMSAQLSQLGHRSTDLAVQALSTAPEDSPPPIRAFLMSQLAVAHASAGLVRPSLSALSDAMVLHGGRDTDPSTPFSGYPVAALHYQRGDVHQILGEYDKSAAAFATSLRHRPAHAHRAQALTLARLSEVLLLDGRVDKACTSTERLLETFGRIRCPRTAGTLLDLRRRLVSHVRRPQVRSVVSRLDGYMAHHSLSTNLVK